MNTTFRKVLFALFLSVNYFMHMDLSAKDDTPPQQVVNLQGMLAKVDAAWARDDNQSIKNESSKYLDQNRHDVGALSLDMFVALYCERDWKKADAIQKEIINTCTTPAQREAVSEILRDTCNVAEWQRVSEDDQLYAKAIAALKRVFKDKFPGSESALLIEVTFYRTSK
jgi:hypothetical protein